MGMTMTQKILAYHAGLESVSTGQLIEAKLDMVLGNDITSPVAINEFNKFGFTEVFDKNKISLVMDHFVPNKDIKAAQQTKQCRTFAKAFGIKNYFDVGDMGIEHALLPEKGLVGPGDVIIGADSHTCTYGALGAFSTGVGSTDMAAGMATGEAWFKVPSAIKFNLTGKLRPMCSGKDVILYIIGKIGVDGALYNIDGLRCIAIGGAYSVDKYYRIESGYAWFADEQPSDAIKNYVNNQLLSVSHKVDVVFSHTCPFKYEPREMFLSCIDQATVDDSTEKWLDSIEDKLDYKAWYCGHWHTNKRIDKMHFLFEGWESLEDLKDER